MEPQGRITPKTDTYTLEGKTPVPCTDLLKWAEWFENGKNRVVSQTHTNGFFISTVFLGLDHNFHPDGKPILFETIIWDTTVKKKFQVGPKSFESNEQIFQDRYESFDEAAEAHEALVKRYSKKAHPHGRKGDL